MQLQRGVGVATGSFKPKPTQTRRAPVACNAMRAAAPGDTVLGFVGCGIMGVPMVRLTCNCSLHAATPVNPLSA